MAEVIKPPVLPTQDVKLYYNCVTVDAPCYENGPAFLFENLLFLAQETVVHILNVHTGNFIQNIQTVCIFLSFSLLSFRIR